MKKWDNNVLSQDASIDILTSGNLTLLHESPQNNTHVS